MMMYSIRVLMTLLFVMCVNGCVFGDLFAERGGDDARAVVERELLGACALGTAGEVIPAA